MRNTTCAAAALTCSAYAAWTVLPVIKLSMQLSLSEQAQGKSEERHFILEAEWKRPGRCCLLAAATAAFWASTRPAVDTCVQGTPSDALLGRQQQKSVCSELLTSFCNGASEPRLGSEGLPEVQN